VTSSDVAFVPDGGWTTTLSDLDRAAAPTVAVETAAAETVFDAVGELYRACRR
jgi:hypothetical protein